jgi:GT2 family glycosyltransferase
MGTGAQWLRALSGQGLPLTPNVSSSVVVVVCRRHRWLRPCLESVAGQAGDVVVVDNGSPDGWAGAEARRIGARAISLRRNAGFPAGVNAGVAACRGEVVALLNDDAMAGPGWLRAAEAVLADPTVGAVSPKLLFAFPHAEIRFGDTPHFAPGDPRPLGRSLSSVTAAGEEVLDRLLGGVHQLETGEGDGARRRWRWTAGDAPVYVPLPGGATPADVLVDGEPVTAVRTVDIINNAGSYLSAEGHGGDYGFRTPDGPPFDLAGDRFSACGAAVAFRAETFRRLGGFAAAYFAYYEDTDWCWRAQLAGLRIRYEPAATVRHVGGVSTGGELDARVKLLAARNRIHTLARNAPLPVLRHQVKRTREPGQPPGLRRALATRVPRGLAERVRLSRRWQRSPAEVFAQWAGVGETWPDQS